MVGGNDQPRPDTATDLTSLHVRRAIAGEDASRSWVVEHFTPILELQARYRLRGPAGNYYEPEDLVHDVWAAVLPRLPQLTARHGRWTPVLVKFLGTTLLHKVNHALRAYIRGDRPRRESSRVCDASGKDLVERIADDAPGVLSRVGRRETREQVRACIDRLGERDREILVLRAIEQLSNQRIAELLGEKASTITMRYRRALDRLRAALPDSVFAELASSQDPG